MFPLLSHGKTLYCTLNIKKLSKKKMLLFFALCPNIEIIHFLTLFIYLQKWIYNLHMFTNKKQQIYFTNFCKVLPPKNSVRTSGFYCVPMLNALDICPMKMGVKGICKRCWEKHCLLHNSEKYLFRWLTLELNWITLSRSLFTVKWNHFCFIACRSCNTYYRLVFHTFGTANIPPFLSGLLPWVDTDLLFCKKK